MATNRRQVPSGKTLRVKNLVPDVGLQAAVKPDVQVQPLPCPEHHGKPIACQVGIVNCAIGAEQSPVQDIVKQKGTGAFKRRERRRVSKQKKAAAAAMEP